MPIGSFRQSTTPYDIVQILGSTSKRRNKAENIIKLNVGSGKTMVGLLLLQSSLNEGIGPALYVSPDKQLSLQVMQEAQRIGIGVTEDPNDPAYGAGETICIANVYKLFNGKSVFGVGTSRIGIGTVIIDDVHACIATIAEQFRIRIPSDEDAYAAIFSALAEDIREYAEARYLEIDEGDPQSYVEVPFWSWANHQSRVLQVLHDHRSDGELQFKYPLIREILSQCRCVIGGQHLEIEPPFPATDLIQSFRQAKRRIYMTATLSDDSVIATHFRADANRLHRPIVPASSQSMGDRMVLMPQELNPDITDEEIRSLLNDFSKKLNVVIVVPSVAAAQEWSDFADQIPLGDGVAVGVDKLRTGHVGLTVFVNRYDGIDLPGEACRILVISDLPEVTSYGERVDAAILGGSTLNLRRQIERIEQGMGRGVRSNDDYCAVIVLGAQLIRRLRSPEGKAMLTAETRAQLDLSRRLAEKMGTPSLDDLKSVIYQCLNRDSGWIKVNRQAVLNSDADDNLQLDDGTIALRSAFDHARANQHTKAVKILDEAINNAEEERLKAWLLSKKAAFQHAISPVDAQSTLLAAHSLEPGVLRPISGLSYKRLSRASGQQASTLITNHQSRFVDSISMKLFADELCADIRFLPDSADRFESSLDALAWFLGIAGQRPERDWKEGPDNLWALPDGMFLVVECKNGVTSDSGISKKDAGQLGQSMEWFANRYPGSRRIPLIVHPKSRLGPAASPVQGMRVIDKRRLEKLRKSTRQLSRQLAARGMNPTTAEVADLLASNKLNAAQLVNCYSIPVR